MNKIVGICHFEQHKDNKILAYPDWSVIAANERGLLQGWNSLLVLPGTAAD
jgi:hypothetical protein